MTSSGTNAVELIQFNTPDGLRLDGALHCCGEELSDQAMLFLHGAASNFYESRVLEAILPALLQREYDVLSINTRGHGLVNTIPRAGRGSLRGGAAYEIVDDCGHDIAGAVDWLVGRGAKRVLLVGHSLGAIKAVYSQSLQPHESIEHVIAISPPRLSYTWLRNDARGGELLASMRQAERLVAAGQGGELMQATFPLPLLITAATYVDKYGPAERYNILNLLEKLSCPTLFVYGGRELAADNLAFAGLDQEIDRLTKTAAAPISTAAVEDADHNYTGRTDELAEVVCCWIDGQAA